MFTHKIGRIDGLRDATVVIWIYKYLSTLVTKYVYV